MPGTSPTVSAPTRTSPFAKRGGRRALYAALLGGGVGAGCGGLGVPEPVRMLAVPTVSLSSCPDNDDHTQASSSCARSWRSTWR